MKISINTVKKILYGIAWVGAGAFVIALIVVNTPEPDHRGITKEDFTKFNKAFSKNVRQANMPTTKEEFKKIIPKDLHSKLSFWEGGAKFDQLKTRTKKGHYLVQMPASKDDHRIRIHYFDYEEVYWIQISYLVETSKINITENIDTWEEEEGIACRYDFVEDCYYFDD